MKKVLFFLSFAACTVFTLSCNKELVENKSAESAPISINVRVNNGLAGNIVASGTKVTGLTENDAERNDAAEEARVNSLQVFVFKDEQCESSSGVLTGTLSSSIPVTSGERTIWAVVNAPDLGKPSTLTALSTSLSKLSDNELNSFVMSGSVRQTVRDGGTVDVTVKRIVARVSVNKVSTAFKDARSGYSVDLQSMYLINVPGDSMYGSVYESTSWINKLAHNDASYDDLLYDDIDEVIKNGKPHVTSHYFYPYPNVYPQVEDNFSDTWAPRGSILVLQVRLLNDVGNPVDLSKTGQTVGYYPIVLPVIERNKTYTIGEVILTKLPGLVPYKPIETGESYVNIVVNEWEDGLYIPELTI